MRGKIVTTFVALATGSLLVATTAFADVAGSVTDLSGVATVQSGGKGAWRELSVGSKVSVGDHIRTASNATCVLSYNDGSTIGLEPDTELVIDDQSLPANGAPVSLFSLNRGKLEVSVPKGQYDRTGARFEVKTTTAVAGVRGTKFTIEAE